MKNNICEVFADERENIIADMHTHSEHSHDSICPIEDMASGQIENKTAIFAVTDHCDVEYFDKLDLSSIIGGSVNDAKEKNAKISGVEILRGVEIGEGFWNKTEMERIVAENDYDVIIGAVHAVRFEGYTVPYSTIDFGKMGAAVADEYLSCYFDDVLCMLENTEFDILAHLTCPLRYINGNYGLSLGCRRYEAKIKVILEHLIRKNIALEINTSCKDSSYNEFMPEEWIIKLYKSMGGHLVTLGSDAHIKENASHCFDEAIKMLKSNGFENLCYYKNRKCYSYKI